MWSSRAVPRPAPQVSGDDEDDVGAVVAMSAHHHARVIAGIEGEIGRLWREGQPFLEHKRVGAIGVPLSLDGLPRDLGVVDVSEHGLGTGILGLLFTVERVPKLRECRSYEPDTRPSPRSADRSRPINEPNKHHRSLECAPLSAGARTE